ncbi:hypothetical protein BJ944DRAFT_246624 [Cunninghamella echinulata]|nr:hypothetical protein BJ944DRAFT_246624 [Cunninghamella echinulata]
MNRKTLFLLLSLCVAGIYCQEDIFQRKLIGFNPLVQTLNSLNNTKRAYCPGTDCGSYCCRVGQMCAPPGCCPVGYFPCRDSYGQCCPNGSYCIANSDKCSSSGTGGIGGGGGGGSIGGGGGSGGGNDDDTTTSKTTTTTTKALPTPVTTTSPQSSFTFTMPEIPGIHSALPTPTYPSGNNNNNNGGNPNNALPPNNVINSNPSNSIYLTGDKALYLTCLVLIFSVMIYYL